MRGIVETVADSLSEVTFPQSEVTIVKHDPLWRNPRSGKTIHVYGTVRRPAFDERGAFTTGSRRDIFEFVVEYVEAANQRNLKRDEAMELAAYDMADSISAWADSHKSLGTGNDTFDLLWRETRYAPDVAREFLVRYCLLSFEARRATPVG